MLFIDRIKSHYLNSLAWLRRHESRLSPLAMVGGFVLDNLTLRRVDLWAENLFILTYLMIALLAIMLLTAYESGKLQHPGAERLARFLPFALQFVLGGLASVFLVFYSRSASFVSGWPFLVLLLGLLIGNERFRGRYQRLVFRLTVYYAVVFAYSIFALPLLARQIGDKIFILSGLASLAAIAAVVALLWPVAGDLIRKHRTGLASAIAIVYLSMNILYFMNLIPPLPLSLKTLGVYHELKRTAGGYALAYEPAPRYAPYRATAEVFHWTPGRPVYAFSAIFAPGQIKARIYHVWSRYDEAKGEWVEVSRLSFPITGGRDGGYRGYSLKQAITPGRWQVAVVTETGQSLGRTRFTVVETDILPPLTDIVL